MAQIISLTGHSRRVLLCRFAQGAALLAVAPVALAHRSGATDAPRAMVRIDNFSFAPTPITIAQGTTVTWVNQDDIPHSIYCEALNLHSHPLDTDESFAHQFSEPGRFDYICAIHPHMRGQVIVQA